MEQGLLYLGRADWIKASHNNTEWLNTNFDLNEYKYFSCASGVTNMQMPLASLMEGVLETCQLITKGSMFENHWFRLFAYFRTAVCFGVKMEQYCTGMSNILNVRPHATCSAMHVNITPVVSLTGIHILYFHIAAWQVEDKRKSWLCDSIVKVKIC